MNYEAARTERGNVCSNVCVSPRDRAVCACIYIVSRPTTTIPTTPAFSLSVCTFFIGFVIGREARTLYIYIIYIGAATISGAHCICTFASYSSHAHTWPIGE